MLKNISLYDTASKRNTDLAVDKGAPINLYVCGPTVYDTPHIGNARPAIVFGTLVSMLRNTGATVNYVSNYTDVDDKIIVRAEERGISIEELCEETIQRYHNAIKSLGVTMPDHTPRATDHIGDMVEFIQRLIDRGHAYEAEGHVLFDTQSSNGSFLVGKRDDSVARIEPVSYKRDQSDFVLWKPEWKGVGWESPWGKGRPGWHIECSAMIKKTMGNTIDIHGGGHDLIFPHHEAECQQSFCANRAPLAKIWMHCGMVMINGRKMSKSEGNFVTVEDILERGLGDALRLSMLQTHYRQPYDFSWERLEETQHVLMKWQQKRMVSEYNESMHGVPLSWAQDLTRTALQNDLNFSEYFAAMCTYSDGAFYDDALNMLGIGAQENPPMPDHLALLFEERIIARAEKNFAKSDQLRALFTQEGIELLDGPEGTEWRWLIK